MAKKRKKNEKKSKTPKRNKGKKNNNKTKAGWIHQVQLRQLSSCWHIRNI